jgi:FixJ family two-component response regulator
MVPHVAVVFLTGRAGSQDSVQAMKGGVVDFLEKLVSQVELFAANRYVVAHSQAARRELEQLSGLQDKYELLTRREREVFRFVAAGLLNKQIAFKLGTAERTIKAHRGRVMEKLGAESLAQLVRIADQLGIKAISREHREKISGRRFTPGSETIDTKIVTATLPGEPRK